MILPFDQVWVKWLDIQYFILPLGWEHINWIGCCRLSLYYHDINFGGEFGSNVTNLVLSIRSISSGL